MFVFQLIWMKLQDGKRFQEPIKRIIEGLFPLVGNGRSIFLTLKKLKFHPYLLTALKSKLSVLLGDIYPSFVFNINCP